MQLPCYENDDTVHTALNVLIIKQIKLNFWQQLKYCTAIMFGATDLKNTSGLFNKT